MNNSSAQQIVKTLDGSKPDRWKGYVLGIGFTLGIAAAAGALAKLPILSMLGVMILSILIGVLWKTAAPVPAKAARGIAFSSKYLLRAGIILMGLRLNFSDMLAAGWRVLAIDAAVIAFTLGVMMALGARLRVDRHVTALLAAGTAVCGAAAIAAAAPVIGAKKESTALAVAAISILGTIGTIIYVLLYPYIGSSDPYLYGVFAGSTLHELAHVVAAGVPGGEAGYNTAILVKLGRVALLMPVVLVLGGRFRRSGGSGSRVGQKKVSFPWFVLGFLAMSLVNTAGVLPQALIDLLISASVILLSAAMAGVGLGINLADFKKLSRASIVTAVAGYIALTAFSAGLIGLLY